MRVLAANLILALGVATLGAPSLALAQSGSAQDRIEAAASALEGVQSMRFVGETDITPDSTGTAITAFSGSGDFQAPDRVHMTVDQPMASAHNETITIGQAAWLRTVDGTSWAPLSSVAVPPSAKTVADELRQVSGYMVNPTVTDGDSQTTIDADVNLAQAVTDESPVAGMLGAGFSGDSEGDQGTTINNAHVTITIDQASNLPVSMTSTLNMVPAQAPDGIPDGPLTINTTLTLSDFNSPDVVVNEPASAGAPADNSTAP
jgi:hypothetical protein